MIPNLLTIYVEPPYYELGRVRTIPGTPFEEIWPKDRTISNWYFLTENKNRVYLKVGWNLFGRRNSNNIRIMERNMKSCELTVYVDPENEDSPLGHSVNNNCFLDGVRMSVGPETLYHRSAIGIFVQRTSKLIVLEFFNADIKKKNKRKVLMNIDE